MCECGCVVDASARMAVCGDRGCCCAHLRRGTHRSVKELVASIRTWIANWNEEPKPVVWHKSADEILDSLAAYCQRINDSGH